MTERLERSNPLLREEDWEYLALCDAAAAAVAVRERPADRRVVVAADMPSVSILASDWRVDGSESLVTVSEAIALRHIVSFHVGEDGKDDSDQLLWYDATELDTVAAMFG